MPEEISGTSVQIGKSEDQRDKDILYLRERFLQYGNHLCSCPLSPGYLGGGLRAVKASRYHRGFNGKVYCSCGYDDTFRQVMKTWPPL